jgi:hypothetical protein
VKSAPRQHADRLEEGSMLPMFGGLILIAFIVIALAVEISLLGQAYRIAAAAADTASEAGAAMLAEPSVYASHIELDIARADGESRVVAMAIARPGASVSVTASTTDVCVTVMDAYHPRTLVFLGVDSIDIAVTSCAEPRTG